MEILYGPDLSMGAIKLVKAELERPTTIKSESVLCTGLENRKPPVPSTARPILFPRINPLSHMPILGSSNSTANKAVMS